MKWKWLMMGVVVVAGCATTNETEEKEKGGESPVYMEAKEKKPEPKPPEVVPVPVAQPSPGQARPAPPAEELSKKEKKEAVADAAGKEPHEIMDEANKKARKEPVEEGYYNAIQRYDFARGMLYQVYAAENRVTALKFGPGEKVKSVALGDTTRWILGRTEAGKGKQAREIVLVKPVRAYLDTNMTVTTDRRVYQLELHSYEKSYMAAVTWNYPRDLVRRYVARASSKKSEEKETKAAASKGVDVGGDVEDLNFNYAFVLEDATERPRWMPERVFDDGRKTYIQFPRGLEGEAPALFILSKQGKPQVVNYRKEGDFYVVDRLFDTAQLRLGDGEPVTVGIERREESGEVARNE